MNKRKLKGFVLPTIYVMTLSIIFITIVLLGNSLTPETSNSQLDYSVDSLTEDEVPVVSEVSVKPVKPFLAQSVNITRDYYSKDDESDNQSNSLIYYQDTYLQNTGILYNSTETFDVFVVLDGTVKNISTDEIMGIVVEVTHEQNLTSFYYSLSETQVEVGTTLKTGDVIGKSGNNKIENIEGTSLLFEIYYQGKTIDPNVFYESDLSNY